MNIEQIKLRRRLKSVFGMMLLVILLTTIIDVIMLSSSYLPILNRMDTSPFDWDLPDLIYSMDGFKEPEKKHAEIVLVNWRHLERDSIALLIDSIKASSPRVIGLDAIFSERKDSIKDIRLQRALEGCNVVCALDLKSWDEKSRTFRGSDPTHPFFLTSRASQAFTYFYSFDPLQYAYGSDNNLFVRTFSPSEHLHDTVIYCFALELVRRYDEGRFKQYLSSKLSKNEELRYFGDTSMFVTLDYKRVVNRTIPHEMLRDKIVILTFLGYPHNDWRNAEGKFMTPMNPRIIARNQPDMYGGAIHANIVAGVLNGVHIRRISWLTINVVNFVVVVAFMFLLEIIHNKSSAKLPLYGRISAYTFAAMLTVISLVLYFRFDTRIDFRLAILYIIALPEVYLIYLNRIVPLALRIKAKLKRPQKSLS